MVGGGYGRAVTCGQMGSARIWATMCGQCAEVPPFLYYAARPALQAGHEVLHLNLLLDDLGRKPSQTEEALRRKRIFLN